jgi:hypothetical protein
VARYLEPDRWATGPCRHQAQGHPEAASVAIARGDPANIIRSAYPGVVEGASWPHIPAQARGSHSHQTLVRANAVATAPAKAAHSCHPHAVPCAEGVYSVAITQSLAGHASESH